MTSIIPDYARCQFVKLDGTQCGAARTKEHGTLCRIHSKSPSSALSSSRGGKNRAAIYKTPVIFGLKIRNIDQANRLMLLIAEKFALKKITVSQSRELRRLIDGYIAIKLQMDENLRRHPGYVRAKMMRKFKVKTSDFE